MALEGGFQSLKTEILTSYELFRLGFEIYILQQKAL